MLQKGCFAASTLIMTHQQAQYKKMKSKQQIKIKTQTPANPPPPAPESMQPACITGRKTTFPAGKNQHRRLFSFPKPSITGKKPKKKLQNRKNQQNKKKKTKPKLQIISSNIKSKQQI
jgi:hypothetical protein